MAPKSIIWSNDVLIPGHIYASFGLEVIIMDVQQSF